MKLSDFLKTMKLYYGNKGMTTADFVREVFCVSVTEGEGDDLFSDDSLPKKLYSGSRDLSKPLREKLAQCSDKARFIAYLERLTSFDALDMMKAAFGFAKDTDVDLFFEEVADIFFSFIKGGQGKPSVLHNLQPPNPHFVGRKAALDSIRECFESSRHAVCLKQAIFGLGGVGKSQIALEYAHRYLDSYKTAIWFIYAETETSISNSFRAFAEEIGFVRKGQKLDAGKLAALIQEWQGSNSS